MKGFESRLRDCEQVLSDTKAQMETAKIEVEKPFAHEDELAIKLARLEELNALLNMDKRDNELTDASADEVEEQNSRRIARNRVMER